MTGTTTPNPSLLSPQPNPNFASPIIDLTSDNPNFGCPFIDLTTDDPPELTWYAAPVPDQQHIDNVFAHFLNGSTNTLDFNEPLDFPNPQHHHHTLDYFGNSNSPLPFNPNFASPIIDLTTDDPPELTWDAAPVPDQQHIDNVFAHFLNGSTNTLDFNEPLDFPNPQHNHHHTLDYFGNSSSLHDNYAAQRIRITDNNGNQERHNLAEFAGSIPAQGADQRGKRKLDDSISSNSSSSEEFVDDANGRFIREEERKEPLTEIDFLSNAVHEAQLELESESNNANFDINHYIDGYKQRVSEFRRKRFRELAKENATRFARYEPKPDVNNDGSSPDPEVLEHEIFDSQTPFSNAMKIIKERGMKRMQTPSWVPKRNEQHLLGARFSVPSLQEMCLQILARNADAIVSLDGVPDDLRHRLSQLLCDSRKMNDHCFELLVSGSPTEIRLKDCSWLSEEQFTKFCQTCDTANLRVLQLDQCGRCIPDYALLATLPQSPSWLPRLTSLSLRGACRLSNKGLHVLVSSAPVLGSINLSQCSLLTSASLNILANSLGSLLKELYLDDCQSIDAPLIVPALKKLDHLEVLSLAGIQSVSDEFIKDYIIACGYSMKELVLKDCIKLTDASMKVIAEHCPGLCVLDLMNLCKLTDLSIGYLTNSCRALHMLKLCRNPFSDEAIAAFLEITGESMKELSLNNIRTVGHHTTLALANHGKNLRTLDLSWCRNLTDNELGLIVDGCFSLRLLKLFGCTQVTDVFLNGHSNPEMQIIGLKMSPLLQHVKMPGPHQGALRYSSVSINLM